MDPNARANKFMDLFRGSDLGYYRLALGKVNPETQKREGIYNAIHRPVTNEQWFNHLRGAEGHGLLIIPINSDNECWFGALDVDEGYGGTFDHAALAKQINDKKLPLWVFKSKSGGAHVYLLLNAPISAERMREILADYRMQLGLSTRELFPKQSKLSKTNAGTDMGSGINMPYFGESRQCVTIAGELDADNFLDLVAPVAPASIKATEKLDLSKSVIKNGPPCLQTLTLMGKFPSGSRNNGLYNLALYAQRAFPNEWESKVYEYHKEFCPSQEAREVANLIEQIKKNTDNDGQCAYKYKCKEAPIQSVCNSKLCRTREFGIASGDEPIIKSVVKYKGDEFSTVWVVTNADGISLTFTHQTFTDEQAFGRLYFEATNEWPTWPRGEFKRFINALAKPGSGIFEEYDVDPAMTTTGQVDAAIRDFSNTNAGVMPTSIKAGQPFHDWDNGRVWFRMYALEAYIAEHGMKGWSQTRLLVRIKALKGGGPYPIEGLTCFWIPAEQNAAPDHANHGELKDPTI